MLQRSPILNLLLAFLLAISPALCLCGPKAFGSVTSCSVAVSEADGSGCCGAKVGGEVAGGERCVAAGGGDQLPAEDGCGRCGGSCACRTAPTMMAEPPATVSLGSPVASPTDFHSGFMPTRINFVAVSGIGLIESRTIPRPLDTLLRQHCALTI